MNLNASDVCDMIKQNNKTPQYEVFRKANAEYFPHLAEVECIMHGLDFEAECKRLHKVLISRAKALYEPNKIALGMNHIPHVDLSRYDIEHAEDGIKQMDYVRPMIGVVKDENGFLRPADYYCHDKYNSSVVRFCSRSKALLEYLCKSLIDNQYTVDGPNPFKDQKMDHGMYYEAIVSDTGQRSTWGYEIVIRLRS